MKEKENGYFEPDVEDLCIGYECEVNWNAGYEENFVPLKIELLDKDGYYQNKLDHAIAALDDGYAYFRTPYLTREQIIKEGWQPQDNFTFKKDHYLLYSLWDDQILEVFREDSEGLSTIFFGKMKSINELRKLQKMLGI